MASNFGVVRTGLAPLLLVGIWASSADANGAPTFTQPFTMSISEGARADQTLVASDPDGDPLIFSKAAGPTFVAVNNVTSTIGNIHARMLRSPSM
jgi:hypothetical protein